MNLPSKEKPSSGWGLMALILAAVAITASMCQTVVDKIETEEINQPKEQP